MSEFDNTPEHHYYVDSDRALPILSRFLEVQIDRMVQYAVEIGQDNELFSPALGKSCHFRIIVDLAFGVQTTIDVVFQLGRLLEDGGVHSKEGDFSCIITATWQDYKLEQVRVIQECLFSPTSDWFPIVVGMFSPVISAAVNSTLERLGMS
jgi:hypothetical protein